MGVSMINGSALSVFKGLWREKTGGPLSEGFANVELILSI
jgi:hypothetical protein